MKICKHYLLFLLQRKNVYEFVTMYSSSFILLQISLYNNSLLHVCCICFLQTVYFDVVIKMLTVVKRICSPYIVGGPK